MYGSGEPWYLGHASGEAWYDITMNYSYKPIKQWYWRNLPHWQVEDGVYFVTIRLNGSLPKKVVIQLKTQRDIEKATLIQQGLSKDELRGALKSLYWLYFGKFDELLDKSMTGPRFLNKSEYAEILSNAIKYFDEDRYQLICFTIMSNHAHLILYKLNNELDKIMGSIKKYTARRINILRDKVGQKVWHEESFDHVVRDRIELAYYVSYILDNAVKINLVKNWKDYPNTYLRPGFEEFYRPELLK